MQFFIDWQNAREANLRVWEIVCMVRCQSDDEKKVLQYVADLFEEDYLKRPEEGVHFFYTHRWDATNTNGSVSCHPVRLQRHSRPWERWGREQSLSSVRKI